MSDAGMFRAMFDRQWPALITLILIDPAPATIEKGRSVRGLGQEREHDLLPLNETGLISFNRVPTS